MANPPLAGHDRKHFLATVADSASPDSDTLRIAYLDCAPLQNPDATGAKDRHGEIIVLLHGFPQSSYQFRHAIPPLCNAGYRVIAPDYRGAGKSSKPSGGFNKATMAEDIYQLLVHHLKVKDPIHLVGHDIGGMIAWALASRHPKIVHTLVWGECPLPGTRSYEEDRTTHAVQQFHFIFHSVRDLPEALVAGRERVYLEHFFDKLSYNASGISEQDVGHYVDIYSRPGALRCAFDTYRAFEQDAAENRRWLREHGKCRMPTMALSGAESRHSEAAKTMSDEAHEAGTFEIAVVEAAGHWLTEENPEGFVRELLRFVHQHPVH